MLKDILLTLRKEKRYTQADVAKLLCISRQAYNHYETGVRIPPTDTLQELANVFSVTTDYLLGVDNSTNKNTHLSETERRVLDIMQSNPAVGSVLLDVLSSIENYTSEQAQALITVLKAQQKP